MSLRWCLCICLLYLCKLAFCDYKSDFSECCARNTQKDCVPMCKYEVTFEEVEESFLAGRCPPDQNLDDVIRCGSKGKNVVDCCKKIKRIDEYCLTYCDPDKVKSPSEIGPQEIMCAFNMEKIMKCYEDAVKTDKEEKPKTPKTTTTAQPKTTTTDRPITTTSAPRDISPKKVGKVFDACCDRYLDKNCGSLCNYNVSASEIRASLSSKTCPAQQFFQGVHRCAALGRNNKKCCRKAGLARQCMKYCSKNPKLRKLKNFDAICAADAETIFTCHYNGAVGKDNWKTVPDAVNSMAKKKPQKDEQNSKETTKEKSKEESKKKSKESSKEKSKESSKEKSKESSKEKSKESSKEKSKESSKEKSKESSTEKSKESSKEKSTEKSKETSKGPIRDPEGTFRKCCEKKTRKDCLPLCKYDVSYKEVKASYFAGTCPPEKYLNPYLRCASADRDNRDCCKKIEGMSDYCLRYCTPRPNLDTVGLRDIKCTKYIDQIMKCHKDGTQKSAKMDLDTFKPEPARPNGGLGRRILKQVAKVLFGKLLGVEIKESKKTSSEGKNEGGGIFGDAFVQIIGKLLEKIGSGKDEDSGERKSKESGETSKESTEKSSKESTEKSSRESTEKSRESTEKSSKESTEKSSRESTEKSRESTEKSSKESTEKSSRESTEKSRESTEKSSKESTEKSSRESTEKSRESTEKSNEDQSKEIDDNSEQTDSSEESPTRPPPPTPPVPPRPTPKPVPPRPTPRPDLQLTQRPGSNSASEDSAESAEATTAISESQASEATETPEDSNESRGSAEESSEKSKETSAGDSDDRDGIESNSVEDVENDDYFDWKSDEIATDDDDWSFEWDSNENSVEASNEVLDEASVESDESDQQEISIENYDEVTTETSVESYEDEDANQQESYSEEYGYEQANSIEENYGEAESKEEEIESEEHDWESSDSDEHATDWNWGGEESSEESGGSQEELQHDYERNSVESYEWSEGSESRESFEDSESRESFEDSQSRWSFEESESHESIEQSEEDSGGSSESGERWKRNYRTERES